MKILSGVILIMLITSIFSAALFGASYERDNILKSAYAAWKLGDISQNKHPLTVSGDVRYVSVDNIDNPSEPIKIAYLTDAYFNAGDKLQIKGDQITVYLRARDPLGRWSYGLFNKRGTHIITNFNLFSADLPGIDGPDIGFEIHTDNGFIMVRFPVSRIDPTAWHDIAARYDGKTVELICDGTVMAKKSFEGGQLTQNTEPVIIGAETNNGQIIRPFTGEMEDAAMWSRALTDKEIARLMDKDILIPDPDYVPHYDSPIHFRPKVGNLADTIPFYWKGEYHVFYLLAKGKVQWEHLVSRDLVNWKELPTALISDGPADGPDGMQMFTGSVIEKDGIFHIFYTGHNPLNPEGLEFIMHATSSDMIHWTKHPSDIIKPDGKIYRIGIKSDSANPWNPADWDFRDPYVFFNEDRNCYWMVFLGDDEKSRQEIQGLLTSTDLVNWKFMQPLSNTPGRECPDMFKIDGTWYLIGGDNRYYWSENPEGPYKEGLTSALDWPFIYAAKRMFDGKRHIWVGWLWDRDPENDAGARQWGGTMNLPREIYSEKQGLLYMRPAQDVIDVFDKTIFDLKKNAKIDFRQSPNWKYDGKTLSGSSPEDTACSVSTPDNYMLECTAKIDPDAVFTIVMRDQNNSGDNYRLIVDPSKQEADLAGPTFSNPRNISLDPGKPLSIRTFVQGTMIECFINDQYAFSCRGYNSRSGDLSIHVRNGLVTITDLKIKTTPKIIRKS